MRLGLISGHGAGDCGACGCGYEEANETVRIVKELDERFRSCGIDTVVYDYNRNAFKDCNNGTGLQTDFINCDYVLEIHLNSGRNDENGDGSTGGVEIYVTPREETTNTERIICSNMEELGFRNRGVKTGDFLVINKVKNLGVSSALLEICFIDDKDDMNLYEARFDEICNAIVRAVCEGFGVDYREKTETNAMSREEAENYVSTDYIEFLNRPADPAAEGYITALMSGDMTENDVDNAIKSSQEYNTPHCENDCFKTTFTIMCYYYLLGRFPESEDVIREKVRHGRLRDIYADIYNSEEAGNRRGE